MNNFELALKADLKRNYREAIEYYTKSVESEELLVNAHINLIVILMIARFDFGLTSFLMNKYKYTEIEMQDLFEYLDRLLQKSLIVFESTEVTFWKYYNEHYLSGFSKERIKEILIQNDSILIPYFQIYIDDLAVRRDVSSYKAKIDQLREELSNHNTIKNEYILSLIKSAEDQVDLHP